jgi:hypothetical protein
LPCSGGVAVVVGRGFLGTARCSISPGRRLLVRVRPRRIVHRAIVAVAQSQPGQPALIVRRTVAVRGSAR